MHKFIRSVHAKAKNALQRIVLPEGTEERILRATEVVINKGLAKITLLGPPAIIKIKAKKLKLKINFDKVRIIDPKRSAIAKHYAEEFYKLRKHKGMTKKQALETVKHFNYFGTMMVFLDDADGMVTGTTFSTADSIRPALEIIKTKKKFHKVSGVYFMVLENRLILFADTAINVDPNAHDLKDIAIDSAETAKKFGIKPKIAMLSFSTKGSAEHNEIDKIQEAVNMLKYERPKLIVDGELQVDAALIPEVAKRKCPSSPIKGDANILIFPNLEAGNIAYKLVERLAKAKAIGPILQGLNKPVNDLSRGCSYQDIVNVIAFTAAECT